MRLPLKLLYLFTTSNEKYTSAEDDLYRSTTLPDFQLKKRKKRKTLDHRIKQICILNGLYLKLYLNSQDIENIFVCSKFITFFLLDYWH